MKFIKLKALSCVLLTSALSSCSTQEVSIFDPLILNTYDTSIITDDNGIRLKEGIKKNFLDEDNNHLYEGKGVCVHPKDLNIRTTSAPFIDFYTEDLLTISLRVEKNIHIDDTNLENNYIHFKLFPGYYLGANYLLETVDLKNFYIGVSFFADSYNIDDSTLIRINDFEIKEKYLASVEEESGIYNDCYINYFIKLDYLKKNEHYDKRIHFYLFENLGDGTDIILEKGNIKLYSFASIKYEFEDELITFKYPTTSFY